MERIIIPLKLPSLNDYINACRTNRYAGASMKAKYEGLIAIYLIKAKKHDKPVKIKFTWIEGNKRRDYDNVSGGGRKFILDALVECGKLKDDNRRCVVGFEDEFRYGDDWCVILDIEEVEDVKYEEKPVESWWIIDRGVGGEFCAMCGEQRPEGASNYCPSCGCKMREVGDGIEMED